MTRIVTEIVATRIVTRVVTLIEEAPPAPVIDVTPETPAIAADLGDFNVGHIVRYQAARAGSRPYRYKCIWAGLDDKTGKPKMLLVGFAGKVKFYQDNKAQPWIEGYQPGRSLVREK